MVQALKLDVDFSEIERAFDDLSDDAKKSVANALNRTGSLVNKNIRTHIINAFAIKKATITRVVTQLRVDARRSDKPKKTSYAIVIKRIARGLHLYGASQKDHGVGFSVRKGGGGFKSSAFISSWKKEGNPIFVQVRDPSKGTYMKGNSIRTKRRGLFGPRVADLYLNKESRKITDDTVAKNYQDFLNKDFERRGF